MADHKYMFKRQLMQLEDSTSL